MPTPISWAIMNGLLPLDFKGEIPQSVMVKYAKAKRGGK